MADFTREEIDILYRVMSARRDMRHFGGRSHQIMRAPHDIARTLSVIESAVAKLRMYLVPDFLGVASALSALAVIFTIWVKR